MGWGKPIWTAEEIKARMPAADAGKDLYIAGVPRGLVTKTATGTIDITGSGWIVQLSASRYAVPAVGGYQDTTTTLQIDGDTSWVLRTSSTGGSSISIDTQSISTTFDSSGNLLGEASKSYVMNAPKRFGKSLHFENSHNCGSLTYILDCGEGGVTRKLTQITSARAIVPNIDFEGRCAA